MTIYLIITAILLVAELVYFQIAYRFNINDKPNSRSSHTKTTIRGGGIIFLFGLLLWGAFNGFRYPWFILSVVMVATVSFIDDISSLPNSVRLTVQFVAMIMIFHELHIPSREYWWIMIIALIVFVGASNIINFMDGINGITGTNTMAVLISLLIVNRDIDFAPPSLMIVIGIADIIFSFFNFRPKGKAICFAGDVGSIGIAYILLFLIGDLIMTTKDASYLVFLLVYGVDGCLTICHRIMLHENLGKAHRKHAYQIMANELNIGHQKVSLLYMALQIAISMTFLYLIPNTVLSHWIFLISSLVVLAITYIVFMKKYYHLHEKHLQEQNK